MKLTLILLLIKVINGEKFEHQLYLDPEDKLLFSWTATEDAFTAELSAETRGYAAIGFSPRGDMINADIFMAWVDDDGVLHGKDMYATDETAPKLDDEGDDWRVLGGYENETHTVVTFKRNWRTCDRSGQDFDVYGSDTARLIWALHPDDPKDGVWPYHNFHRGI